MLEMPKLVGAPGSSAGTGQGGWHQPLTPNTSCIPRHSHTTTLTWWHSRGDGGGRNLALALGGHSGHLDGVGGEGGEAGDTVLQRDVGQVVGHPCVGAVVFLPGDPVA